MNAKPQSLLFAALAAAGWPGAAPADDAPVAVSAPVAYSIDTRPSPRAVKTAAEQEEIAALWPVARQAGDAVSVTAPDGTVSALGGTALSLGAGGVWTLESSRYGKAVFTVRRSLDGTLGAGTAASPARLVDGDELADYGAGSGYVFLLDSAEGIFASLRIPSGFRLESAGGGLWRIVASEDGRSHSAAAVSYAADSTAPGPDRTTTRREAPPVAYTGDGWVCDARRAASLAFVAPDGTRTDMDLSGTGAVPFRFRLPGDWTVRLEMADGTILSSVVSITAEGFVIVIQ